MHENKININKPCTSKPCFGIIIFMKIQEWNELYKYKREWCRSKRSATLNENMQIILVRKFTQQLGCKCFFSIIS